MQETLQSTKPHYLILDGLRGVAAILVAIFHLFEAHFPSNVDNPIHHGYLAVDFFFLLSGYVVGYAYDDRWGKMSVWQFFKIRLVRLYPLVIIGALIGAICFALDPFSDSFQQIGAINLIVFTLLSFTLLPSPDVHTWGETHSLNGPAWSLLQEYIANVLYAVFGRKMLNGALWVVVGVSGTVLAAVTIYRGDIGTGWSYDTFWIAVVRMMFPFFAGLLLFRLGKKITVPFAFTICSALLAILFVIPVLPFNGLYESAVIIVIFPIIVAMGAGSEIRGYFSQKLCRFFGDISYPIYILHYPFIYLYIFWVNKEKPSAGEAAPIAFGLAIFFVVLAYGVLKLYDEPVRAWLKKKLLK